MYTMHMQEYSRPVPWYSSGTAAVHVAEAGPAAGTTFRRESAEALLLTSIVVEPCRVASWILDMDMDLHCCQTLLGWINQGMVLLLPGHGFCWLQKQQQELYAAMMRALVGTHAHVCVWLSSCGICKTCTHVCLTWLKATKSTNWVAKHEGHA